MALTLESFREAFPEFVRVGDTLVQAAIDRAALEIGSLWGTSADAGQGFLAAHYLATAPQGQNARLAADTLDSTYGRSFRELRTRVTCCIRVP